MEAFVINRKLTSDEENGLLGLLKEKKQSILYSNVDLSPALRLFSKGEIDVTPEEKK
ncbi:MAG: hypothetical protein K8R68_10270 [Bacteroidales bacterium]|nr:hypothetical protein [Bacteroidales bacterium]